MKNVKIIAISNQKGGVGKTTTCINIAASLGATGRKILLADLDPQANSTTASAIDKISLKNTVLDVVVEGVDVDSVIISNNKIGFDLLPANRELVAAEAELIGKQQKETRLKNALDSVKHRYDFILIDCPPSLGMLTINALMAANSVIIPVQCEYYALEGIADLMQSINGIQQTLNQDLYIEGVLRTLFDARSTLSQDVSNQLLEYFGEKVYDTIIPRNVRLAEAPSHGLPAILYDINSKGAQAYIELVSEILRKQA